MEERQIREIVRNEMKTAPEKAAPMKISYCPQVSTNHEMEDLLQCVFSHLPTLCRQSDH